MPALTLASARWSFREASAKTSAWLPATVPGCVHTDLLRAGKIPDPFHGTNELSLQWIEERDWEYRAEFTAPPSLLAEEVVELCADGLDTVATVFLNGKKIAATENMFVAWRWDVRRHLRVGKNELRVLFRSALDYIRRTRVDFTPPREFNDPVGNCVRIRKQQCQFGWDWGPRFVTAGVWRDIRLEAWSRNRLVHVSVAQHHAKGAVSLALSPELVRADSAVTYDLTLSIGGTVIVRLEEAARSDLARVAVPSPRLWWPAGQGEQPLYTLVVEARDAGGRSCGVITKRLGLRTIVIDQSPDAEGKRFRFVVNDRPVFIKGANWIPAHSFVAALTRADFERDLRAAVLAHMNCVRLWGGGVYEGEDFYDLCDELGLLVWHDFMFACSLYPSDRPFLASVRDEAACQLRRLHHRACIGLWCGNNELVQINGKELRESAALKAGYETLFHKLLPEAVAAHSPQTAYWPSSEWRGTFENGHEHGVREGDTHFWDVWHARKPVKDYELYHFRFCSEFGMQSYSSPETNATFAPAGHDNVFGPVMENHQKNRAGNQIILDYVSRRYRFPKSQDDLIYLSQLNQAYCMQVGVEHYRRTMPHCMGAIYWQLNDCWPVASWSSIEFTGRWKALHHVARRFNAPALVSAHVPGDEGALIGNYRVSNVREVHLFTVYDAPAPAAGLLRWDLFHLDGRVLLSGKKRVRLRHNESVRQHTVDLAKPLAVHGRDQLYLRIALNVEGALVSEDTVFLTPPRFLELPRAKPRTSLRRLDATRVLLTLESAVFQHRVALDFPGLAHTASDNYLELYPREKKQVVVTFTKAVSLEKARRLLRVRSLVDSY
ncbi:MAG: glycoside hydrolase family 2 protein [Opitutaceae bacterium]|jgi:beta-mannosidase|nr:glycoside hydrolase family 2 protein [Opitutaceae bacterium]